MKLLTCPAWLKNSLACHILVGERSTPVTLQPNSAKGSKLPPSQHPTSRILVSGVN